MSISRVNPPRAGRPGRLPGRLAQPLGPLVDVVLDPLEGLGAREAAAAEGVGPLLLAPPLALEPLPQDVLVDVGRERVVGGHAPPASLRRGDLSRAAGATATGWREQRAWAEGGEGRAGGGARDAGKEGNAALSAAPTAIVAATRPSTRGF